MEYRGFDINTTFDDDYPAPNNYLVSVNRVENREYVCKWYLWFADSKEGSRSAKAWIDAFLSYPIGKED